MRVDGVSFIDPADDGDDGVLSVKDVILLLFSLCYQRGSFEFW